MLTRIRPRLTYANVMSSIAVFVVLGGGAYATHTHRIGTQDLRNGAVTTPKLDRHAVGTAKLKRQAVGTGKLKPQAVGTGRVKPQAIGAGKLKEPAVGVRKIFDGAVITDKLADGAVSASKLAGLAEVTESSDTVANGDTAGATASCPEGTRLIAGGFDGAAWRVERSVRVDNGWHAFGTNQTGGDSSLEARAYCLAA